MGKHKLSVRDFCHIGIFTAIIAALSQLSIPTPYGVPMTLQSFAIPLAGVVLGAKKGTVSTLIYVLLGLIGVPVFSGFSSGLGVVVGITGGFVFSFPLLALTAGFGESKNNIVWLVLMLITGATINFLCGMYWFSLIMSCDLKTSLAACVLPFIPTTIIKIALVVLLGRQIKNVLYLIN